MKKIISTITLSLIMASCSSQTQCIKNNEKRMYEKAFTYLNNDSTATRFFNVLNNSRPFYAIYDSIVYQEAAGLLFEKMRSNKTIIKQKEIELLDSLMKIDSNNMYAPYYCRELSKFRSQKKSKIILFPSRINNYKLVIEISKDIKNHKVIGRILSMNTSLKYLFEFDSKGNIIYVYSAVMEYD